MGLITVYRTMSHDYPLEDVAETSDPAESDGRRRPARARGNEKLRRQIVFEAARLMYRREEKEYYRAKLKAARAICQGWVKPSDLPSNTEIRDEIQRMAFLFEGIRGTTTCATCASRPCG